MIENHYVQFPNQKAIHITLESKSGVETVSFCTKTLLYASRDLKPAELKVFLYLSCAKDGYELLLSPQDIVYKCGGNKQIIQRAINGLIQKGYLVPVAGKKNDYVFIQKVNNIMN